MKLIEIKKRLINYFNCAGIERPSYVADIIISHALSINRGNIVIQHELEVSETQVDLIDTMAEERLRRRPLSYIVGESEFYGRQFKVGSGCFIPRPETELLVEEVLNLCPNAEFFADWCTGSGCIGISILLESPNTFGYGIDSSPEALKWAKKNSEMYSLSDRFFLLNQSEPSECNIRKNSLDFIISNPPYIPSSLVNGLMIDVLNYEPNEALDGGVEGLDVLVKIIKSASNFLKPNGIIAFETDGKQQIEKLQKFISPKFELTKVVYDYNGIARHIICQLKSD